MDKNTIIGSLLIGAILLAWLILNPRPAATPADLPAVQLEQQPAQDAPTSWTPLTIPPQEQVTLENKFFRARFALAGAQLVSLQLAQHANGDDLVDLVSRLHGQPAFFALELAGIKHPETIPYLYQQQGDEHVFSAGIQLNDGGIYRLEKRFRLSELGYMIAVDLSIRGEDGAPLSKLAGNSRYLYQLSIGPQIGPNLGKIGSNQTSADIREYRYYDNQKVRRVKFPKRKELVVLETSLLWAAIEGKYFAVAGLPRRSNTDTIFRQTNSAGQLSSSMAFARRLDGDYAVSDSYYYYLGPKRTKELSIYEKTEDNDLQLSKLRLATLSNAGSLLGWLEIPIKWVLQTIYHYLVPNYGVAIFILAILIRILLAPLTIKSYHSTSRMQQLQPKMKILQERYKEDQLRLQRELSQLYKKEGVSPMGGCLPMLLQMPIIIAVANLFYRYFEFRGAVFIPGWIDDLSVAESIYSLSIPDAIPLLGPVLEIRLLPVIYLASQLLLSKIMQQGNPSQSMGQMKLMMTLMPFMFFFILYSMPSGLIMYWTISNILTMLQQMLMAKRKPNFKATPTLPSRKNKQGR